MQRLTLETSISHVPLIGPAYAKRLEKLAIGTVRDLLYHLPSRYDDFSLISKVKDVQEGETLTVQGTLLEIKNIFTARGFVLQKAQVQDESGILDVMWFNQRFLTSTLHKGDSVSLSGKIGRSGNKLQMESPVYEILPKTHIQVENLEASRFSTYTNTLHTGRLVPVYPETHGITSKWLRNRINWLLSQISYGNLEIIDYLDESQRNDYGLLPLKDAILTVHFPKTLDVAAKSQERLAFDELLFSQLEARKRKDTWEKKTVGNKFNIVEIRPKLKTLVENLPFELTRAQKKVIDEIYQDLTKPVPMNRLLQGDVGSGKTVVAALSMLASYLNGYQSALMAPTEILANQHFETITKLMAPLKISVGIATGSRKSYEKCDIIVGTHALLSEQLNFTRLGLIVIDEQHRFGVSQRAKLTDKGINPHVLTMTATPIPRTIALTLYGDLNISILDEMPKNRLPVRTWVVPKEKRLAAYDWISKQNTQTFIICPLIEESETLLTVKSAKKEFDYLSKEIFSGSKLGLLHGRMKPKEKDKVLNDFRTKKLDILVSTPVVEVGIDIPSATIMLIEAADRFGLAGLHQLRGRVGRGERQSYCLLFTENDNPYAVKRLKSLETVKNGLQLAETDLKYRGPGQRFGTAQHGKWDLKIADFSNLELIEKTNTLAQKVLQNPNQFPLLKKMLEKSKIQIAPN